MNTIFGCHLHFLFVIHACDGEHSLGDEKVVSRVGILSQQSHVVIFGVVRTHELIEDVIISLDFQLESDARLFQEVGLDIG